MKKNYQRPATMVVEIATKSMVLAGSAGTPSAGLTSGTVGAGSIESRHRNDIWNDDEEDF